MVGTMLGILGSRATKCMLDGRVGIVDAINRAPENHQS